MNLMQFYACNWDNWNINIHSHFHNGPQNIISCDSEWKFSWDLTGKANGINSNSGSINICWMLNVASANWYEREKGNIAKQDSSIKQVPLMQPVETDMKDWVHFGRFHFPKMSTPCLLLHTLFDNVSLPLLRQRQSLISLPLRLGGLWICSDW